MSDADIPPSSSLDAVSADGPRSAQEDNVASKSSPSPPQLPDVPRASLDRETNDDGEGSTKAESEAETIIQSGRESLSPEKRRKHIKHAPRDSDEKPEDGREVAEVELSPSSRKRKRDEEDNGDDVPHNGRVPSGTNSRSRTSSSVSSIVKKEGTDTPVLGRRDSNHSAAARQIFDKNKHSRKRSSSGSMMDDDLTDKESRAHDRRPQPSIQERERREKTHPATNSSSLSKNRSLSPPYHSHKRASSGSQHGVESLQRKRKPAPLADNHHRQSSEDRQSISSSASASPMPSARSRRFTLSEGAHASLAKSATHKKQRDQNGRTRLARACAAQEYEVAMARHAEHPEDLNVADNAGNTPLQIASLEGCAPIVKFLLNAGCEIDTKNIDKDTPLIDAVENGHLEVIKLLLDAGANPRLVNAEGDEPYDLVPSDTEDYDEIRKIIARAKTNPARKRRSEDHGPPSTSAKNSVPRATSGASPRDSPPAHLMMSPPPGASAGRRKTVRSEATRNDLLWTKATPENLCNFAAKGDMAGVANILNVIQKADSESLIAAAKGCHEDVMSLLLGMGDADADPEPVQNSNCRPGYNTPMLAAIGRGNLAIIRLLLDQPGFNPTRRLYRTSTYFELAEERKGEGWEEEVELLKRAYDKYKGAKKAARKADAKSPKRSRDQQRDFKKAARRSSSSPVNAIRKPVRSPTSARSQDVPGKESIKKRDSSSHKKDKSIATSRPKPFAQDDILSEHSVDHEMNRSKKALTQRRQSDASSINRSEEVPKRRRLIAGRPPDRDRRRHSLMSTDSLSGREESFKSHIRAAKELKDTKDHKDTLEIPAKLKRPRGSISPERSRSRGSERARDSEELVQKKKRRLQAEESSHKLPNGTHKKIDESSTTDAAKISSNKKDQSEVSKVLRDPPSERGVALPETSITVKQEHKRQDAQELDRIPMDDGAATKETETPAKTKGDSQQLERDNRKAQEEEEGKKAAAEIENARIAKEEETARKAEQARIAREIAEEEERKRKEIEQRRIKQQEEERQRRAEQERMRIARLRKEHEEQEQRRRDALPNLLRIAANLVGANDPRAKSHVWLKQFMPVVTARTAQLDPSCSADVAEEAWVPNFLVAPLLATNDLQLSQYASWEKRQATSAQRLNLWRVTRRILVQGDDIDVPCSSFGQVIQKDGETRPKYFGMEHIFWVKMSDFMDLVPHIPHLHGLDIDVLKMHIDQEPSTTLSDYIDEPKVNGNEYYPSDYHEAATSVNGLTNGYGHTRPSTYV
jgi:Ankyrin repeats (3 copies)